MKLTACLIILSLISAYWSTGTDNSRAVTVSEGQADCSSPIVPEQPFDTLITTLQRDHPPIPLWWDGDMEMADAHRRHRVCIVGVAVAQDAILPYSRQLAPAGDVVRLPGDKAGLVRRQEGDQLGHVLRRRQAAQWYPRHGRRHDLVVGLAGDQRFEL